MANILMNQYFNTINFIIRHSISHSHVEKERDRVDDILRLSALREEGRKELLDVLDAHRGRKEIVADSSLIAVIAAVTTPMPGSSSNAATNG